jgi:anti-sigma B factor antagonist
MSQTHISMDVRIIDDKISIIAIRGELSSLAEGTLMDAYLRACAPSSDNAAEKDARRSPVAIIFDFRQMDYMNSSGIGLLVTLLVRMNRLRQRMLAYGLSEHYQQIFAITRLDEAIGIFDTESEALVAVTRL